MNNAAEQSNFVIAGLGEVLWDIHPGAKMPGGAPANVAYHATMLGNHGMLLSRVGHDILGSDLKNFLSFKGVDVEAVQIDTNGAATGTVRVIDPDAEARYEIAENVAWDHFTLDDNWVKRAEHVDATCFGTLAQRSKTSGEAIRNFLSATNSQTIRMLDMNLRDPFYDRQTIRRSLQMANVVKMNSDEAGIVSALFETDNLFDWMKEEFGISMLITTKGSDGAEVITDERTITSEAPSIDVSNGDVVGAGDAFTAAMLHFLLRNTPVEICLQKATNYASFVVSKKGAMPNINPKEILEFSM